MNTQEIIKQDAQYYLPVFSRYDIALSHGEGPYVYDENGKKYLDFLGGIAVNVLGHAHPVLVEAISSQAGKLIHCSNLYYTRVQAAVAAKLSALTGFDKVFLANSGAEANEGAIKLARKYGKKQAADKIGIITAEQSFHGRTYATLTATGQPKYHEGFEPLPAGFSHVPYNNIEALRAAASDKTCAIMLEPIQGEGGVHVPSPEYLPAVRELCDRIGAVLIFDEIQAGMGRTGKFLASQTFGVQGDIATLAKGLGGGVPIGAFLTTDKIAAVFHAGDHGTTFGGNPLAAAAAEATLRVLEEEGLMDNAVQIGAYLTECLEQLRQKYPNFITKVRGSGLIIGAELTVNGREFVDDCLQAGAIINCTAGNVLRFVPPLNITRDHVDELMSILEPVLAQAAK